MRDRSNMAESYRGQRPEIAKAQRREEGAKECVWKCAFAISGPLLTSHSSLLHFSLLPINQPLRPLLPEPLAFRTPLLQQRTQILPCRQRLARGVRAAGLVEHGMPRLRR